MRKIPAIFVLLTMLVGLVAACLSTAPVSENRNVSSQNSSSVEITDSTGARVALPHTAARIISLNDDATELLLAIGAADKIVGVPDTAKKNSLFKDKLAHAGNVGNWINPDVETLLALKPDVVIGYSTAKPRNLDKLLAANVTVIYIDAYRLSNLSGDAVTLGQVTGNTEKAKNYSQFVEDNIALVTSRLSGQNRTHSPRIYVEAYSDYSVMTPRSAGGQMLDQLGCRNLYANTSKDWATVSPEWIIDQNPDIILKIASSPETSGESLESVYERIMNRSGYSTLNAIRNNRIYVVNGDLASSPRAVIGFLYMAKAVYPDLFTDVDPDTALHAYAREFLSGSDRVETYYPPLLVS